MTDLERAHLEKILAEQRAAARLLAWDPDSHMARLWLADAVAEEVLMLAEVD